MKTILTIATKDFKGIVLSPMFLVISGLCTAVWSYVFWQSIKVFAAEAAMPSFGAAQQSLNIHFRVFVNHASFVNLIFLLVVPALTMRLISEEKKQATFDLLLTTPITASQIAIGKFLGGFFAVATLVGISALYPLGTAMIAKFPWTPLILAYVGILLVAGTYVAVGLFASSLTDSVVLSVVLGFIFNLMLWFLSQGQTLSDDPTFTAVMSHISLGQHFLTFLKGTVQITSIVFFASCIGLFLFLTQRVIESARWR